MKAKAVGERLYLGVDIGGTKIQASLVAESGTILARQRQLESDLLVALAKQEQESDLEAQIQSSGTFDVLDAAVPPEKKSGPSTAINSLIAFVLLALIQLLVVAKRRGMFSLEALN